MENASRTVRIQSDDLENVVRTVKSHINVYETDVNPLSIRFFFFLSDNPDLTEQFDSLRTELVPEGYIPFLVKDVENFIEVSRRPATTYRSNYLNLVMLVLTLASTIYVGSIYAANFVQSGAMGGTLKYIYGFVFFSAPLMLILGVHETGHYIVARRHNVKASLPFFIPFPIGIGTFGAFISLRDPIPNKKVMLEIGAAGPIAGFLTALPLLFVAEYVQGFFPPTGNYMPFIIHFPLLYSLLGLTTDFNGPVFPMVFSVWVGIFATAMNLIPVGQLDGGHVVRGLLGKRASVVDYIFVAFLFLIGFRYNGWWFLAMFVVFMGLTHPPALDDYSRIPSRDILLGIAALIMFIMSFTITPLSTV